LTSPDDKHDSSSSSSNASSASSSEDTVSSEDDSILAFASHKITNITDIVSKKQQRQTSTRIGKEIKKLTAAAKVYDLRPFYTDRGTIKQRKTHFVHWANKLRDMLGPIHRYNAFMRDYPKLNPAELTVTANTALGLFLRLKLGPNAMHPIEEAIGYTNKDNGHLILQFLLNHYGSATDEDIARAKQLWENTTWVHRDTIDTHSQRFLKRLSLLRDSVATRPDRGNDIPTNDQASMKYLSLLVTSLPKSHGLRSRVQALYSKNKGHCSIREVRHERRNIVVQTLREQLTEEEHIDSNNTPDHPRPSRILTPSRPPAARPPPRHIHHTRFATALHKKKKYPHDIKCWGCGRGHHLRDCPTTSLEMRQRIWEEYRQKRRDKNNTPSANKVSKSDTTHSRQHRSPTTQHNHGNVASLNTDAAIAPASCDFTAYSMTSRRPERANAVRHKATRAECRTTVHSHNENHPTPTEPPRPPTQERSELVTSVTDW
jgi:hypothetical protein